jgi:hypothetical protein
MKLANAGKFTAHASNQQPPLVSCLPGSTRDPRVRASMPPFSFSHEVALGPALRSGNVHIEASRSPTLQNDVRKHPLASPSRSVYLADME